MQPVAVPERAKALAAQTKPARAGVRCKASAEPHLTANAGRCEWYSRARMRTAANALAVRHCCANEALQGWCAAPGSEEQQIQLNADAVLLQESNRRRMRAVALLSESIAAQMEPAGRSAAPGNADRYGVGCSSRLTA